MIAARSDRRLQVAGAAISVLALAGVVWWASRQEAPELPRGAGQWSWAIGALVLYGLVTWIRSMRWRVLLLRERVPASRSDCFWLTTVTYMGNTVLPARAGDALRVVLLPRSQPGQTRPVVGTLLAERLLDVITLTTLLALVGAAYGFGGTVVRAAGLLLGAAGALALLVGAMAIALRRRGVPAAVARARAFVAPMLAPLRGLAGRAGLALGAVSLAMWLLESMVWFAAARAVGLDISPLDGLFVLAFGAVALMIPSGPGFAGTLDAAVIVALGAIDVTGGQVIAFLVMARFVIFVPITIAGLGALVFRYGGLARLRTVSSDREVQT